MSNRPDVRITFWNKETKATADVGAGWINESGRLSFKFNTEDKDGKYPKMSIQRAVELVEKKVGYLNGFPASDVPRQELEARGASLALRVVEEGGEPEEEEDLEF